MKFWGRRVGEGEGEKLTFIFGGGGGGGGGGRGVQICQICFVLSLKRGLLLKE